MHAVIETGGQQYRVKQGDVLRIEKIAADEGSTVEFDKILMVNNEQDTVIGKPYVEGAKVSATVKAQARGKKISIIKFRRRKHHMKRQGHRQSYTWVVIDSIDKN